MAVSESDLGGFATTYEDALAETEGYSSYDSPSDSYPVNQNYKQRNLSRYQNAVPFGGYASNYQAPRGFATEQDMREGATNTQDVMGLLQRMGFIKAVPSSGEVGQEQVDPSFAINYGKDVTQDMTKVGGGNSFVPQSGWDINAASPANPTNNPFDLNLQFNQDPAAKAFRDNISGILNPTGEQIAAMHDKAAQGEQTANWARDKFFGAMPFDDPKPKIEAWRKGVRSDIGDAFKTGLGAVGDVIGDGWDNMTEAQVNKADPVPTENFEALAMPTARNTDYDAINQARYSAFNKAGTLGNTGPVGPDGTNFSPNRWSPYEQMANTQASATSGADNIARILNTNIQLDPSKMTANLNNKTMTDALTYKDRQAMSKKQIVELINNRGTTSTIHAVGYEEYDRDPLVPSSYSPIYSYEDENLINLFRMKGFDAEDFRIYPQQQQNIKGGGQTSLGLPGSFKDEPLLSVTPGIDLMGAGIVGLGSALAKFGTKSVGEFVSKFGKDSFDMLKGMLSKSNETNLSKLANSPINRSDDILTVTEQGLMKPAMSNKFGLGTHTPKELGTINRNTPIQGENIYTNSKILSNRNRLNAKSIPVSARKANRRGRK